MAMNELTRTTIGVVAIGTLGTQALPNKERNLFIRNQKILCSIQGNKFKWIVLNLGHQEKEKSPPRKSLTTPIMQVTLHTI